MKRIFGAALLGVFWSWAALAQTVEQGIIVTGEGRVMVDPDMVTIRLGVVETGETSQDVVVKVSEAAAAIQAKLAALGVAPQDRQTAGFYLQPIYERVAEGSNQPPKITGYRAGNTITVRVRNLDQSGNLMGDVIDIGVNNFNGLSFSLQDQTAALAAARKLAVLDASLRATQLADAAGLNLGSVLRMTENSHFNPPAPMMMAESRAAIGQAIVSGEIDVNASVTMVFAIAPGVQ